MITTHVYIGKQKCGCMVAVVNDEPGFEKDTAREVADFIKSGLSVTRITFEQYRSEHFGHTCGLKKPKQPEQLSL